MKGILRAELDGSVSAASTASAPTEMARTAIPAATMTPQKTTVNSPPPRTDPMTTTMTSDPLAGSVACVKAVLRMYKESCPAER